jgi:acetyl-CoA carboxylase carboxyltransferase component
MSVALAPAREDLALGARERLEALCDPGSLQIIRSAVRSTAMGEKSRAGDGVLAGAGEVGGRPVFCYAQDPTYAGGSLGGQHAGSIVRVLELADRAGAPVVGFVSSGGARMQEGIEALGGYGRIFHRIVRLSRRVPQISIITGLSAGGGAYSPALTDWVVMTRDSSMFLTGPWIVREALGEDVSAEQLGGTRVHERNGVCHLVASDDFAAAGLARELLAYLPAQLGDRAPRAASRPPRAGDPGEQVPREHRRAYDVREVIARLVDGGELFEVSGGWARNLVTGFARIDGRSVGVIANQ